MSEARNGRAPVKRAEAPTQEIEENSIGPVRRRAKAITAAARTEQPMRAKPAVRERERERERTVPEDVRRRFVQIKNEYFFPDGARAFKDRGDKLTTQSENTEVIRSLMTIAQSRGWDEIRVRGSERFRREAWVAAQTAGLNIRGYKPTELEESRLARAIGQRSTSDTAPEVETRGLTNGRLDSGRTPGTSAKDARPRSLLVGTLVEHGRAPYRHDMKEAMSYYAKIETSIGERTVWGVDLERAFKESLSKPVAGDVVGLRAVRQDPVTVKARERDDEGKVTRERDLSTMRNRWIVEKREFLQERAAAAQTLRDPSIDPRQGGRKHPELVGTYLQIHAAEIAAKQIRDPDDQKRFVEKVREALASSVARGEPLPPVRLKERDPTQEVRAKPAEKPPRQRSTREREAAPARG